jgi:hypothetical protein
MTFTSALTHFDNATLASGIRRGLPRNFRLHSLTWRGPPPRFHESVWGVWQKVSYLNALRSLESHLKLRDLAL